MSEAEILLEDVNPNGNLQAVVEADDEVTYLYLTGKPETNFELKTVWVRNHGAAPKTLDRSRMKAGLAPRQPAPNCTHPRGQPQLDAEDLRLVWLPEGNGVALYERDEILAIIPPWSGDEGFAGYACDAVGEGPHAWELSPGNALHLRFQEAARYWAAWDGNLWKGVQSSQLKSLEQALGPYSNYYAIDGGAWPPKAMVRVPQREGVALVTVGVALRPQPNVERYTDTPELYRRIELGVMIPSDFPREAEKRLAASLSGRSGYPWNFYAWIGPGHTVPCDAWRNPKYSSALLSREHPAAPGIRLELVFGDPVNILWALPITAEERQQAIDEGSESLRRRLPADRWKDA